MFVRYQIRKYSAISTVRSWAVLGSNVLPTWVKNAVKFFEIRNRSGEGIYYVSPRGKVSKVADFDNGVYR